MYVVEFVMYTYIDDFMYHVKYYIAIYFKRFVRIIMYNAREIVHNKTIVTQSK